MAGLNENPVMSLEFLPRFYRALLSRFPNVERDSSAAS